MKAKTSNHSLSYLAKELSGNRISLYIRYKYGTENPQYKKTDLVIPKASWDKKKKEVKSREEYEVIRTKFRQLEEHRLNLTDLLNTGHIQPEDALDRVRLYHTVVGFDLLEFFEEQFIPSRGIDYNPTKYYSIFNRLEENLTTDGKKHLIPLKIEYFKTNVNDIVKSLYTHQTPNTATEYIKKLNTLLKQYNPKEFPDQYFKGWYKTEATTPKKPVEIRTIRESIINIKTLKQLEAFLFWMYSFSLRGLDGQDVTLVEDSLLIDQETLSDYIFEEENYDIPIHIELSRKKTRARKFTLLVNAYPAFSINNALKDVIRINRPNEVNEQDGLKLFKWDRITNPRRWNLYADFLQGRLTPLIGASFKSTRHTFTSTAEQLGTALSDQQALIGNRSRKGSISHYSKLYERRMDLIHLDVIGKFDLIKNYIILLKHVKQEFDLDLTNDTDKYIFATRRTRHLASLENYKWTNHTWGSIIDRELTQEDSLEYDYDDDVYLGTL